ncbi:hypothetical protein ACSMXN_06860 [Jatrophihabitans sp. DSM 45814]
MSTEILNDPHAPAELSASRQIFGGDPRHGPLVPLLIALTGAR